MSIKKTLGGDRLGAGKKMTVNLDNFGRSSHDVSKVFRSDQAAGTLVPAWCQLGTTGTTFYAQIRGKVRTLPTVGPIFGSFKQQVDVFVIPIRLYIAALHNNALGVGLKMSNVKLPMVSLQVKGWQTGDNATWSQVSQDSLLAYLGIRGLGYNPGDNIKSRNTQALYMLAYWDIYKNYYANKQEEIGYVIYGLQGLVTNLKILDAGGNIEDEAQPNGTWSRKNTITTGVSIQIALSKNTTVEQLKNLRLYLNDISGAIKQIDLRDEKTWKIEVKTEGVSYLITYLPEEQKYTAEANLITCPKDRRNIMLQKFALENIDTMRERILAAPKTSPFLVNAQNLDPYKAISDTTTQWGKSTTGAGKLFTQSMMYYSQQGLGVKTYMSDMFNNWLSTEWIEGTNGIADLTAIDVSDGTLKIDTLILKRKMFDMLNRVAVSGGSYNDWQEAVYGVRTTRMAESPIYVGGMASEIVFDEVVSNAATTDEPLGSLAGRGKDTNGRSNQIKISCEEPSIIMAITSITPRIDYSQGNKWWTRLETMDDLHKPNLDAIGFQDLITEEMLASDTTVDASTITMHGVGKQVSWIQYMTDVNETYGDFAAGGELDWMALNRQYEADPIDGRIVDATTYIDPQKFNYAFADSTLSAKNFWVQIAFDVTARRVMSAKQIPNL